jgi:hypothetical protein
MWILGGVLKKGCPLLNALASTRKLNLWRVPLESASAKCYEDAVVEKACPVWANDHRRRAFTVRLEQEALTEHFCLIISSA